jgi:membrane-associated phospholipid phosphatase
MHASGIFLLPPLKAVFPAALLPAALAVSALAVSPLLPLLLALLHWAVDSRAARRLAFPAFLAVALHPFLKLAFCVPRPWLVLPALAPSAEAIASATGYSFPSGHVLFAGVAAFGLASLSRRPLAWFAASLWVALVAFSRLVLCVHTPLDVAVGAAVSLALVLVSNAVFDSCEASPARRRASTLFVLLLLLAGWLWLSRKPCPEEGADPALLAGAAAAFACAASFFLVHELDRSFFRFSAASLGRGRIPAAVAGLLVAAVLALKLADCLAPVLPGEWPRTASAAFQPLFVFLLWPLALRPLRRPAP